MTNIFQIWITDNDQEPNFYIKDQIKKLKSLYSDCSYALYTDKTIKEFLQNNFDKDVLRAYNKCKPYSFKSDLVRCCLLYMYGGYYFDTSICPEFKLEHNHEAFTLLGEPTPEGYGTLDWGIMYFKTPKDKFLKTAIENITNNILTHNYGVHPLAVTGPILAYNIDHSHIALYPCSIVDNEKIVEIDNKVWFRYVNGFSSSKSVRFKNTNVWQYGYLGTNNYADMWFNKDVFIGRID